MREFVWYVFLSLALLLAAGCKSGPKDEQAAIRRAVEAYLSQRGNLNLAGMDMDIQVVRMDARTADINVTFRAKQGGGSMQMAYQLERQGDGWMVKGSRSGTGASHPDVGTAPPPAGQMPSGHPPMTPQPAPQQAPAKRP